VAFLSIKRDSKCRISDVATECLSSIDWISCAESAERNQRCTSRTLQPTCGYTNDTAPARWLFLSVLLYSGSKESKTRSVIPSVRKQRRVITPKVLLSKFCNPLAPNTVNMTSPKARPNVPASVAKNPTLKIP
jgi:hypothetical protein